MFVIGKKLIISSKLDIIRIDGYDGLQKDCKTVLKNEEKHTKYEHSNIIEIENKIEIKVKT